eukprot:TRINITY_DN9642_c0_g1_i2.p1 TRINITY_DN9642_c0_g1~~TRINITY_DN9642_c0_g1_i2.p1  ORF type:complete len:218 (+),score=14.63 TRINITY_DN9642_c0_g1_i2:95-748(+)
MRKIKPSKWRDPRGTAEPPHFRIGIDIGGVLISRLATDGGGKLEDTFFSDNFLSTRPVQGAFEAVAELVSTFGANNVHLVSKCGQTVQNKTLQWLQHMEFYQHTGVPPGNVHFCLERHEKAAICTHLAINAFVDDRADVLGFLLSVPTMQTLFWFSEGLEQDPRTVQQLQSKVDATRLRLVLAKSWADVVAHLRNSEPVSPIQTGSPAADGNSRSLL